MSELFKKSSAKFLEVDFNQCFNQMRHYDSQIWDITKFAFSGYTLLLGSAVGINKYSLEKNIDLNPVSILILMIGLSVGIFMYCLIIRNRTYFIRVTHYINEHREHFLKDKPLGFENKTRFYTKPYEPSFFDLLSSQLFLSYLLALLNGLVAAALLFISKLTSHYSFAVSAGVGFMLVQIVSGAVYLKIYENKHWMRKER